MPSEKIDEITARYSVLHSLSTSDLEDSLEQNIYHTQAMWAKQQWKWASWKKNLSNKLNQSIKQLIYKSKINSLPKSWRKKWHTKNRCQFFHACTSSRQRKWRPRAKKYLTYQLWMNNSKRLFKSYQVLIVLLGNQELQHHTQNPS